MRGLTSCPLAPSRFGTIKSAFSATNDDNVPTKSMRFCDLSRDNARNRGSFTFRRFAESDKKCRFRTAFTKFAVLSAMPRTDAR